MASDHNAPRKSEEEPAAPESLAALTPQVGERERTRPLTRTSRQATPLKASNFPGLTCPVRS